MKKKKVTKKIIQPHEPNHRQVLIFLGKFFLIYAVLYTLLLTFHAEPLQYFIAGVESQWTGLQQDGLSILVSERDSFFISEQCTGLVSAITLTALIWAGRKPGWKKKLALNIAGLVFLLIVNLIRIYFVIHIGQTIGMPEAEVVHQISWYLMTAIIVALWYGGLMKWGGIQSIQEVA